MNYETLFKHAQPYLKKNDFGIPHTRRVFDLAKRNFEIPKELEELVFCSIILHDIGGSTIEKQYKNGPELAASILRKLGCDNSFIQEVTDIVRTHHDHPDHPSSAFRILYDSDKLAMFSLEEFSHYNSKPRCDWNKIVDLIHHQHGRDLAKKLLQQRRTEKTN